MEACTRAASSEGGACRTSLVHERVSLVQPRPPPPAHTNAPHACVRLRSCGALITKLERIPTGAGQVFVSPITLQGHRSEADLARYTQLYAPRLLAWAQSVGVPPSPPTHQQQQQQQLPPPAPAQARPPPPGPQQAAQHAEMAEARRQHALMLQRQQMLLVQQQHGLEPLPLQQQLALLGQQQQQGRRG